MSEALTLALTLDDLQTEADRRNNPVLTPSMEEDIAYIEALYNSGAKLWTKEMFVSAEAELAKQPLPRFIELRSSMSTPTPTSPPSMPFSNYIFRYHYASILFHVPLLTWTYSERQFQAEAASAGTTNLSPTPWRRLHGPPVSTAPSTCNRNSH
jgi:hypothetical protein